MFEVLLHKNVAKGLKKLDTGHLKKTARVIELLEKDPYPWKRCDLKKIKGAEDTYRIRIGMYRVVYYIEKERKRIHILKLETREKVYNK
ncbi:MAG: type II toxin-antitoxin system RelE/ParE family toxin [Euryarchaeota archaeon]|nr:type II toxin-antitoxin system RelE/ParE family toxin [Euryarchaeota archaeon]